MKYEYHFTISRTDRIWLISLVCVLLAWELIKPLLPSPRVEQFVVPSRPKADSTFIEKEVVFKKKYDYARKVRKEYGFQSSYKTIYSSSTTLSPIRIMEATWKELRAIGFYPNVATNIERYLAAGGEIENESQLMKIYGMDSVQWKKVSPYIIFPESTGETISSTYTPKEKSKEPISFIDLNTATVEELEKLPGIGLVLAERIIKYRNSLGGFIAVTQIKECYGLPIETFEKIQPRLQVNSPPKQISINTIDLKNFSHPYMDKKMAKILDAYRRQHGSFAGTDDLVKAFPADTMWYKKMLPYLVFE